MKKVNMRLINNRRTGAVYLCVGGERILCEVANLEKDTVCEENWFGDPVRRVYPKPIITLQARIPLVDGVSVELIEEE